MECSNLFVNFIRQNPCCCLIVGNSTSGVTRSDATCGPPLSCYFRQRNVPVTEHLVFRVGRQLLAAFLCAILNQILNHFLKRPGPDRLVQKAVKVVTSPSHWLTRHTCIAPCSFQTSSVSAGTSEARCLPLSESEESEMLT